MVTAPVRNHTTTRHDESKTRKRLLKTYDTINTILLIFFTSHHYEANDTNFLLLPLLEFGNGIFMTRIDKLCMMGWNLNPHYGEMCMSGG